MDYYNIFLDIVKYVILTSAIFCVLKYALNYNMSNFDCVITTTILVLLILLAETLYKMFVKEDFNSTDKLSYCSSVCNSVESMADIKKHHNVHAKHHSHMHNKHHAKSHAKHHHAHAKHHAHAESKVKPEGESKSESEEESKSEKKNGGMMGETSEEQPSEQPIDKTETEPEPQTRELQADEKPIQTQLERDDGRGMVMKPKPGMYKKPSGVERVGDRFEDGTLDNEYEYTDYNMLPMADHDTGSFEYGYSFLPPEKWYPQPPNPPVCVTDKRLHVMPVYTTGTPIDVKEWNEARRVMPPDNIKTKYVKEKLNSGR